MIISVKSKPAVLTATVIVLALSAVALAADSCVVPDNASGTATLPPMGCQYICPGEPFKIVEGLPVGTTLELDGILQDFICCGTQCANCSMLLVSGQCEAVGGLQQWCLADGYRQTVARLYR